MTDLKTGNSSYLTCGTARISNNYSRYYYHNTVPTLTVTYIKSELLRQIKASEDNMTNILTVLGETGLLEESNNKYLAFKTLKTSLKEKIAQRVSNAISGGDCNYYYEFLNAYDEAFLLPTETKLGDIVITDKQSGEEYTSISDSIGKNIKLTSSVEFSEENPKYTAIMAVYSDTALLTADSKTVTGEEEIMFELKMPENAKKVTIMLWDTVSGMKAVCEPVSKPKETVMTVMTFNTQHCKNYNLGYVDYQLMADTIIDCNADIVGLNEMYDVGTGEDYDAQTEILSNLTGIENYYFGESRNTGAGPAGNGFLSKYPIISTEVIKIPNPEDKTGTAIYYGTRSLLKVKLEGGITVIVTHFGLNPDEHINAVATALEHIKDEKCILMGDFNMRPDNEILAPIKERMRDTADMLGENIYSYPSYAPDRKIDYIFVSKDIEVISSDIPQIVASDHCPVVA